MKEVNMKRLIYAAKDLITTTFYRITKGDILNKTVIKDNIWARYIIQNYDLEEVLDLEYLNGSAVIDDCLYICDSDYSDIEVNGKSVNPDEALDLFTLDELSDYISFDPPENIVRRVTLKEIFWKGLNIKEIAKELLNKYEFSELARDGKELGLVI